MDRPAGRRARPLAADVHAASCCTPSSELTCDDGTTVKTLWRLHDGALVESVLMRYPDRVTMCVSSQAGCGMACPFCATGQGGLQRNMSTAEIVEQVVDGAAQAPAAACSRPDRAAARVSNVVFMGMGEPLANYKAVDRRRPPADHADAGRARDERPRHHRLHGRAGAADAAARRPRASRSRWRCRCTRPTTSSATSWCPINTRWNVDEVVDAAWEYAKVTKRRVSIEYILIRDINDQAFRADLLAKVLRRRGNWGWVHVNLIPLNPTPGSQVDRLPAPGRGRVRPPAGGQGRAGDRARHPGPRDRRRLRPAGRPGLAAREPG